jgi:hypothetical protein
MNMKADGRPPGLTTAGRLRVPGVLAQWRYARQGLETMLRKLLMRLTVAPPPPNAR